MGYSRLAFVFQTQAGESSLLNLPPSPFTAFKVRRLNTLTKSASTLAKPRWREVSHDGGSPVLSRSSSVSTSGINVEVVPPTDDEGASDEEEAEPTPTKVEAAQADSFAEPKPE
ncbi:hypothetical protein SCP_0400260 [Sparassis crispa]|uniref:Uncharacterized protein n=1 Tax=Sparassis crispa TaxID=139825 RepID=A0A401GHR8_9APHY|nr:hypothetical protein SCP_0400260 [Sparassis crispa]GBE81655.1 hypothetical protein SCP_0400260 [Sparassis crispa]